MVESPNVVRSWRARRLLLHRDGWRCNQCQKITLIRRRLCPCCQSKDIRRHRLPRQGVITAICSSGETIDTLDQVSRLRTAGLIRLGDSSYLCCQVAYSRPDRKRLASLVGKPCRLGVRRLSNRTAPTAPLAYGMKAVLDIATLKAAD